ncbi:unnamed protein product [Schistosoma spindalis]|nr:unnamed protein product [Schistosoma spindale]
MMITIVIISLLLFQSFQSTASNSNNTTVATPTPWERFKNGFHVLLDLICTINSFWQTIKNIFGYIF